MMRGLFKSRKDAILEIREMEAALDKKRAFFEAMDIHDRYLCSTRAEVGGTIKVIFFYHSPHMSGLSDDAVELSQMVDETNDKFLPLDDSDESFFYSPTILEGVQKQDYEITYTNTDEGRLGVVRDILGELWPEFEAEYLKDKLSDNIKNGNKQPKRSL